MLPCEGGSAGNPGPGDLAVLDSNGNGQVDLSAPVYVLGYLFGGNSQPPVLGSGCTPIPGCPDSCEEAP